MKVESKGQERPCWLKKGQQRSEPDEPRQVLELQHILPVTAERSGQETNEAERAKEVKERLAKA